ncbi:D-alanyl-D-alanine carboxypeptidase family protein [Flavonifractor hominis]|uniref:serine-type D-Ala-D-Ala carboxypeptidase n=1 Tax=Flavonifractor hominis TaxID=3133178 RepID=A0ABV1EKS6_9FIRM
MKRILAIVLCLILCGGLPYAQAAGPNLSAASAILVDGASGRVLYAKDAQQERPIASITKLMTALVAVESHPTLSDMVTIRAEWTGAEGSSMYLRAGEELTLESLLYGLLLASGNDAAVAIAGFCAGDVDTFVTWMNERASELGMEHTHFQNPNGLSAEGHYSTAADMATLARVVLQNETLARIVGTKSISIAGRSFTNHNKLLWRYEGCRGLKTGYTNEAGRTLVSCAERDGQLLIAVTLNDPDDWTDHAALFDYGFSAYPQTMLALADREVQTVPVTGGLNRFVRVRTSSDVWYPLAEGERVQVEFILPEAVEAPVSAGESAGRMVFTLNGMVVGETQLLYSSDVSNDQAGRGLFDRVLDFLCGRPAAQQSPAAFLYSLSSVT